MDVSIIILNYKQKGMVKQCIKGIVATQPNLNYELIVVDNNSEDGCLDTIKKMYIPEKGDSLQPELPINQELKVPPIKTIQSEINGGFGYGHNLGFKQAAGKYIMIINPDVALVPGALDKMFDYLEKNSEVGILGPKLVNPDGSVQYSCRRFPNFLTPFFRRTILKKIPFAKKELDRYLMVDFDHDEIVDVDWLFGAILLIRKSLLDKIGFFDERFFMYFEDLDLSRRCWEAGMKVIYFPGIELVHYHTRLSAEKQGILGIFSKGGRYHLASGIKYFAKYFGVKEPR